MTSETQAPERFQPYGGAGKLPVDCCDFSVVDHSTGKEICRCWDLDAAQHIAFVMNQATIRSDIVAAKDARIVELEAALDAVMVGGNHLALHIGANHPPYTANPDTALEIYGAGYRHDVWCAWATIMKARAALSREGE